MATEQCIIKKIENKNIALEDFHSLFYSLYFYLTLSHIRTHAEYIYVHSELHAIHTSFVFGTRRGFNRIRSNSFKSFIFMWIFVGPKLLLSMRQKNNIAIAPVAVRIRDRIETNA